MSRGLLIINGAFLCISYATDSDSADDSARFSACTKITRVPCYVIPLFLSVCLVCLSLMLSEIDKSLDQMNILRKDECILEGKLKK